MTATPIPSGIILSYFGLDATSHTGWTREKDLNSYYLFVTAADDAGHIGGAAQHNHTETGHSHNFFAGAGSRSLVALGAGGTNTATTGHTHGNASSGTTSATISNTTNQPSYLEAIFKTSDGTDAAHPGLCCFWDSGDAPAGWTPVAASDGRLIKGGKTDGGGTGGVTLHTHTQSSHIHTSTSAAAAAPDVKEGAGTAFAADGHTHTQNFASRVAVLNSAADNAMPACQAMMLIENTSAEPQSPVGMIGLWLGLEANIPAGWERLNLDASADMIRCTTSAGTIGTITGNRQHNHTANAHGHTRVTGTMSAALGTSAGATGTADATHSHTWTVNNATQTINQCSLRAHYPLYTTVILVKKIFDPVFIEIPASSLTITPKPYHIIISVSGDEIMGGGSGKPGQKWEPIFSRIPIVRLDLQSKRLRSVLTAHQFVKLQAAAERLKLTPFTAKVTIEYSKERQADEDELIQILSSLIAEGIIK